MARQTLPGAITNPAAQIMGCFLATNVASRSVLAVEDVVVLLMMTVGAATMIAFNVVV